MDSFAIVELRTTLIIALLVLVPLVGFTARFALNPLVDAFAHVCCWPRTRS